MVVKKKKVIKFLCGGKRIRTSVYVCFPIDMKRKNCIYNVWRKNESDNILIPRIVLKNKIRNFVKSGFISERAVKMLKICKVIERDPSIFPNVYLGSRVNFQYFLCYLRYFSMTKKG